MTTPTHFLLVPIPALGQMVSLFRQCLLDGVDLSQSGFLVARRNLSTTLQTVDGLRFT